MKRRRNKQNKSKNYSTDGDNDPHVYNEFNTYGSPTVVGSDHNGSVVGSRPMSTIGAKPRPFVQAYNPEPVYDQQYDNQHYYSEYQPTQQQPQQPYGQGNNYPYDGYYGQQAEPMIKYGRNVPDEVDYVQRHVPDEIDTKLESVSNSRKQ